MQQDNAQAHVASGQGVFPKGFWFAVFGLTVAADGAATYVLRIPQTSTVRLALFVAEYAICVAWAWAVAWRMRRGRGRVLGMVLLGLIAYVVVVGLPLLFAIGVPVGKYRPPLVIWILHGAVLASYVGAWVSLLRNRKGEVRPGV